MRSRLKIFSLSAGVLIGAFSAGACAQSPYVIRAEGRTLVFEGQISPGSAGAVAGALKGRRGAEFTAFRVTSAGGDAAEALEIGELIAGRSLDLEVVGFCNSGCAQYVFVAGKRKRVGPGSIVAFHGSPSALEAELQRSPLRRGAGLFAPQGRRERAFYRKIGVDIGLLTASVAALEPKCVAEDPKVSASDVRHYGVVLGAPGYVPALEELGRLGVSGIEGYWPRSQGDLDSALAKLPFRSDFKVKFIDLLDVAGSRESGILPLCT